MGRMAQTEIECINCGDNIGVYPERETPDFQFCSTECEVETYRSVSAN